MIAPWLALALVGSAPNPSGDALAAWRDGVHVQPVTAAPGRHTIHSYYVANPESPDGRYVLFYSSTDPKGYVGEVRIVERATGRETVLAEGVHCEDAHRAACQQWLSGGRRVAWHEVVDKQWRVVVADVATGAKTVVATDRQVGFGRSDGDLLPMYGCHWNPGPYRDLYLWDARTGATAVAATMAEVTAAYGAWQAKEFGDKPCSIFFPVLSPDQQRVIFKVAAGKGGDVYMAGDASHREGLIGYDLAAHRCLWQLDRWGHPGWFPDSQRLFEYGNLTITFTDGHAQASRVKDVPVLSGSHPSVSPDGRLMVTDGKSQSAGGPAGEWGIMVADLRGGQWVLIDSFDQSKGARSWRRNDPHPAFSADGRRVYYNVSDGDWTRLMVAESTAPAG